MKKREKNDDEDKGIDILEEEGRKRNTRMI